MQTKTRAVNLYRESFDVNIMRPTVWGNPFKLAQGGDRVAVLAQYRAYIQTRPDLQARARKELRGKRLGCCCKPLLCHGDVLAEIADSPAPVRLIAPRHVFKRGHALEVLAGMPDESIQMVVTSPPYYGLRAYGTERLIWSTIGLTCDVHDWTPFLKGKRQRWGNLDTLSEKQASNRGSRANVEALERDGGRYCKTCNSWEGELGQESTLGDYIEHLGMVLFQARRVLRPDGVLFLNLGDSYSFGAEGSAFRPTGGNFGEVKGKDLFGMPWSVALYLRSRGWYLRNAVVWHKSNGYTTSVRDKFTPTYEMLFVLSKGPDYYFNHEAVLEPTSDGTGTRRKRDVWTIPTNGYRANGIHYATFPEALVEPCILAGSRPDDIVLDPFGGIGTVAAVAKRLGRRSMTIDMSAEYLELARKRVNGG